MGILMGGVIRDSGTHAALPFATACITGQFHCYNTDGNGLWNDLSDSGAYAYSGVNVTFSAGGYNPKAVNMTNVGYYPDLGINGLWEVVELDRAPVVCCFTAETRVRLADGSTMRIDAVMVGDFVLGNEGSTNRVTGIERPLLGERLLYAFDGGTPFVTAEHPFLTADGWKAIDPAATATESPWLPVGRLVRGDRLLMAAHARVPVLAGGGRDPVELGVAVHRLDAVSAHEAHPILTVYNLLLDGDHTFIADDFIVHNKNGGGSH